MKNNIRELREKAGISRKELAQQVGVRNSAVAMWENQLNMPSIRRIGLICVALGCGMEELLEETEDERST